MDLTFKPEQLAFRQELCAWFADNAPTEPLASPYSAPKHRGPSFVIVDMKTPGVALTDAAASFLAKESSPESMRSLWNDATGRSPRRHALYDEASRQSVLDEAGR